ncbi:MAG: hypothetical protein ACM3MF_09200 [Anaerolineae bacterium]
MGGVMSGAAGPVLVVEFIGTPGAGKSTFLPGVKEYFALHGMQPWLVIEAARPFVQRIAAGRLIAACAPRKLRGPLLWQVFSQASRLYQIKFRREHRQLMESVLRFQQQRPISDADREHVLHWFINLTGQYSFLRAHARPGEVLLLDEGFVHRVVQLFASEAEDLDAERIRAYLDQIPLPDLLIRPVASTQTCLERVYLRGVWKRFRDRDKASIARFVANAHEAVNIAVEHVQARGCPVFQVVNEDRPASEAIHRLYQQLSAGYQLPLRSGLAATSV